MNFWPNLKKPIFALAPMEEVTDCAFREMFAKYGKPDVMFTEFVSTEGLMHEEGRKKLAIDLKFTEAQRPMVAQIWGTDPEKFERVAEYLADLGFDGIDINMGCPQSKEIGVGACAALIRNPKLAQSIIRATKKGSGNLPVSVKTRLGYTQTDELETWLTALLETDLAAITLHARTKQEMSKVPAHWGKIAEAVKFRDKVLGLRAKEERTLILGNGDVKDYQDGLDKIAQTGCDGVMIGRAAFGNPWIFNNKMSSRPSDGESRSASRDPEPGKSPALDSGHRPADGSGMTNISVQERLRVMLEHAELFEQTFGGVKSFAIMRKHFKAYASGFPGSHELRAKLMETKNISETKLIVENFLNER